MWAVYKSQLLCLMFCINQVKFGVWKQKVDKYHFKISHFKWLKYCGRGRYPILINREDHIIYDNPRLKNFTKGTTNFLFFPFSPSPKILEIRYIQFSWGSVGSGQTKGNSSLLSELITLCNSLPVGVVMIMKITEER